MKRTSLSIAQTRAHGIDLGKRATAGEIYGLIGDLGAGKTEFVRGFVEAFDPTMNVRSPSFSLVNTYVTPSVSIYHFDFYRLNDPRELIEIGFADFISGDGITLIEWADMFPEVLPAHTKLIHIMGGETDERLIEIPD